MTCNYKFHFLLLTKIAVLILVLYSQSLFSQDETKNHLTKEKYKGKVKSMTEYEYYELFNINEISFPYTKFIFNDKGLLNEIIFFYSDSTNKCYFKYNDKGILIEKISYNFDGSEKSREVMNYNKEGALIKSDEYISNNGTSLKYNENGKIIEEQRGDGSLTTYKYDNIGNCVETSTLNLFNGEFVNRNTYKYNDKGYKTEVNEFNSEGKSTFKRVYKYNDKNNLIENVVYNDVGELNNKTIYKYDTNENRVDSETFDSKNNSIDKVIYKYDNYNNLYEIKSLDSNGNMIFHSYNEYIYDKKGNWIKNNEYSYDIILSKTERIFEYYE